MHLSWNGCLKDTSRESAVGWCRRLRQVLWRTQHGVAIIFYERSAHAVSDVLRFRKCTTTESVYPHVHCTHRLRQRCFRFSVEGGSGRAAGAFDDEETCRPSVLHTEPIFSAETVDFSPEDNRACVVCSGIPRFVVIHDWQQVAFSTG